MPMEISFEQSLQKEPHLGLRSQGKPRTKICGYGWFSFAGFWSGPCLVQRIHDQMNVVADDDNEHSGPGIAAGAGAGAETDTEDDADTDADALADPELEIRLIL